MPEIINGIPSAADIETYIVTDEAATALNTTHRGSDGKDHSDVVINTAGIATNVTAIALNTTHRGLASGNPHSVTPAELGLIIGTHVQAHGAVLDDLNTLGANSAANEVLISTGVGALAWESGATARTSIGLGTANNPTFAGAVFTKPANVIMEYNTYKTGDSGTRWYIRHSNSDVLGTMTTTIDEQELGMVIFQGTDTDLGFDAGVSIQAIQNGAAGTKIPTDLIFTTYTDSAGNWDQLVLSTTSNIGVGINSFGTNMTKGITQATGIAPTTSPADCYQICSQDFGGAAGHACPHIYNEDGDIIKLEQQNKADYNNWTAFTDVVDAFVAMGIFDAA